MYKLYRANERSDTTLTYKLHSKVTANPLTKGTPRVKYEPGWTKGRKYMYDQDKDLLHNSAMT